LQKERKNHSHKKKEKKKGREVWCKVKYAFNDISLNCDSFKTFLGKNCNNSHSGPCNKGDKH